VIFSQLQGKCQGKTLKDGARTALYHISLYLCCSDVIICVVLLLFVLFYVVFVCKCVLPPGDNPTAVNKYIIYLLKENVRRAPVFSGVNLRLKMPDFRLQFLANLLVRTNLYQGMYGEIGTAVVNLLAPEFYF
jgi:hypothetical protein